MCVHSSFRYKPQYFQPIVYRKIYIYLLKIERHRLEIIASDSFRTEPLMIDTLISTAGERYDFIVHANQLSGKKQLNFLLN